MGPPAQSWKKSLGLPAQKLEKESENEFPGPLGPGPKKSKIGCTPKGRTATLRSKKGSEKVLGRVLGRGSQKWYGFLK